MRKKQIKYNYAIFKILGHITQGTNLVAIHDYENDIIKIYNIFKKQTQSFDYDLLIDEYFNNKRYIYLPLTLNEYAQFITTLPTKYKAIFENTFKEGIEKCLEENRKQSKKK